MNALNLPLIEELYGQPLAIVPQPLPKRIETWQILAGVAVLSLAAYGAYSLYTNVKAIPKISRPKQSQD